MIAAKEITKDMFPVGVQVIVETIIDSASGWEFGAPMDVMSPFRAVFEVGSIGHGSVESKLEDLIIDLDCGLKRYQDSGDDADPELNEVFSKVRSGHMRSRYAYFRTAVTVNRWSPDGADDSDSLDFSIAEVR